MGHNEQVGREATMRHVDLADLSERSWGCDMQLGTVTIQLAADEVSTRGRTLDGTDSAGVQTAYSITDRSGLQIELADVRWETGDRDVRVLSCEGDRRFHRLEAALRLAVAPRPDGRLTCDLRQARVKLNTPDLTASLYAADRAKLRLGSGVDVADELRSLGAEVGSRSELLGDTGTHRMSWCTVFEQEQQTVPVIAYVATRILPIKNMYWAAGTNAVDKKDDFKGVKTDDGKRRVYIILLDLETDDKPWLYVGETGIPIELRFQQHMVGYKSSKSVRDHGVRLMPELYEAIDPFDSLEESRAAEAQVAQALTDRGFGVKGGH